MAALTLYLNKRHFLGKNLLQAPVADFPVLPPAYTRQYQRVKGFPMIDRVVVFYAVVDWEYFCEVGKRGL